MLRRATLTLLACAALALLLSASAAAASGPPLSVPDTTLAQALTCTRLGSASREAVLFVPGTSETPAMYAWNWLRYADSQGWPYCTVALPAASTGDIQTAAEYVTYAIRTMYALTGRKIQIVGHSQGGMVPRWSLRFWPDTRAMVDDLVGLAPSNHGTIEAGGPCALPGGCPASFWQQLDTANFIHALNQGFETVPGVDYTVAFTRFDEIVQPNQDAATGSSALRGGGSVSNVRVQDICPNDTADHLAMGTYDSTAFAVALDALDHPGPANTARIPPTTCASPFMPGVNPATFASDFGGLAVEIVNATAAAQRVAAEPPLRCYVTNSCPASSRSAQPARVRLTLSPRKVTAGKRTRVTLRGTVTRAGAHAAAARGGIVRIAGKVVRLNASGRGSVTLLLRSPGRRTATLTVPSAGRATASLRVVRQTRRRAAARFTG